MNIRKILYLPTDTQKSIIAADIKLILEKCEKIASQEWKEQKENQASHDGVCPKCKARKEDIVDKIRQVQGNFNFKKKLFTSHIIISIDTYEVNKCICCSNEWKKFKIKYITKTDVVRVALKYLADVINNNDNKKWKLETIQIFDGSYAESIHLILNNNHNYLSDDVCSKLKLYYLRKHYKSVFDA